jgi:hypothetical protein
MAAMTLAEHVIFFWGLVKRWPRATAIIIGGLAVLYFLYYAAVEVMSYGDALLAGLGMALMAMVLKVTHLFVFYRFYHLGEFKGSFLVVAMLTAVPLVLAIAISLVVVRGQVEAPPAADVPWILLGAAVGFSLALGGAARVFYWIGGDALKRR